MHIEQVFFCDNRAQPGWKVILRREVRGRKVHEAMGTDDGHGMFNAGAVGDHEGLRAPRELPEVLADPIQCGRNVRVTEALEELVHNAEVVHKDIGESGFSSSESEEEV
jgi:hypothetical protein